MTPINLTSLPVLLLSDVHLGKMKGDIQDQNTFIRFLELKLSEGFSPVFLGDIFDYWMEYGSWYPPEFKKIIDFFTSYHREFPSIPYITGNHDNWTTSILSDIGFQIEYEAFSVELKSKKMLLHHGDGFLESFPPLNRGLLNRLLRNTYFVNLYKQMTTPKFGVSLMHWFSNFSRNNTKFEPLNDTLLNTWSRLLLEKTDFDMVVCGHDHIPRNIVFPHGNYLNLGSFFGPYSFGELHDPCSLILKTWDPKTNFFKVIDSFFYE